MIDDSEVRHREGGDSCIFVLQHLAGRLSRATWAGPTARKGPARVRLDDHDASCIACAQVQLTPERSRLSLIAKDGNGSNWLERTDLIERFSD